MTMTLTRCAGGDNTAFAPHACWSASRCATHRYAQDEEAELLAELARIKKEREEEAAKRAAEEAAAAASNLQEELIRGNPLIIGKFDKSTDFQVCSCSYRHQQRIAVLRPRPVHAMAPLLCR